MEVYRLEAEAIGSVRVSRTPLRIEACQGSLWLTQEGDGHDYVLEAGDKFVATRPGLVVVQAMGAPAAFSVLAVRTKPKPKFPSRFSAPRVAVPV